MSKKRFYLRLLRFFSLCLVIGVCQAFAQPEIIQLGTHIGSINDLEVYNDELIIGGSFKTDPADPNWNTGPYDGIVSWDGENVKSLGSGLLNSEEVVDLEIMGGVLHVAIQQQGGPSREAIGASPEGLPSLLTWNGTEWGLLDAFPLVKADFLYWGGWQGVTAMTQWGGQLVASAFTVPVDFFSPPVESFRQAEVYLHSENTRSQLGATFFEATPNRLLAYNGSLIAAGSFTKVGRDFIPGVTQWKGERWKRIGSGFSSNTYVKDIKLFKDRWMAVGRFSYPNNSYKASVAQGNGIYWWPLRGAKPSNSVSALYTCGSYAIIGDYNYDIYQHGGKDHEAQSIQVWDASTINPDSVVTYPLHLPGRPKVMKPYKDHLYVALNHLVYLGGGRLSYELRLIRIPLSELGLTRACAVAKRSNERERPNGHQRRAFPRPNEK